MIVRLVRLSAFAPAGKLTGYRLHNRTLYWSCSDHCQPVRDLKANATATNDTNDTNETQDKINTGSIMTELAKVITVDGPGGAGKGTLCQALACELGWHLLDSGSIYRVLALAALRCNTKVTDEAQLTKLATTLDVRFTSQPAVILAGADVSRDIRSQAVAEAASEIAVLPRVREALLARQRAFRRLPGLVADGRDMGTVVFPDAPVKIFLNASAKERATRRMHQLQQQGFSVNFDSLLAEIQQRDERDCNRPVAPLIAASDALILDSTTLSIGQMIASAMVYVRGKLGAQGTGVKE